MAPRNVILLSNEQHRGRAHDYMNGRVRAETNCNDRLGVNLNYISLVPRVLSPCLLLKMYWNNKDQRGGTLCFEKETKREDVRNRGNTIEAHPKATHFIEPCTSSGH